MYLDIFCDAIESAITYLEPLSIVTYLSMLGKEERERERRGGMCRNCLPCVGM